MIIVITEKQKNSKGERKIMATYTREMLEAKTAKDLKSMCVYELGIPGMTKRPKDEVIDAIMGQYGRKPKAAVATAALPAVL